jgi:hypothetical protein
LAGLEALLQVFHPSSAVSEANCDIKDASGAISERIATTSGVNGAATDSSSNAQRTARAVDVDSRFANLAAILGCSDAAESALNRDYLQNATSIQLVEACRFLGVPSKMGTKEELVNRVLAARPE